METLKHDLTRTAAAVVLIASGVVATAATTERALVVGNRFVDPQNGKVLGTVPGGSPYKWSEPIAGESGEFLHENLRIDAATMTVSKSGDALSPSDTARNRPAPKGIVVAANRESNAVLAYRLSDGAEVWRATLPDKHLNPLPTIATGDSFIVSNEGYDSLGWTRVYSADGSLRFVLDGQIVRAARQIGSQGDIVAFIEIQTETTTPPLRPYVTSESRTSRLDRSGKEMWRIDPPIAVSRSTINTHQLSDSSILVSSYMESADSGVILAKLDPANGSVAWRVKAEPFGASHFKYWHRVYVESRGEEFLVVSQGAGGHFVERRKLFDGSLTHRWTLTD